MTRRTDTYQGHLPDGSGIQAHSAGGLYPCVLVAHETAGGLRWSVILPRGTQTPAWFSYEQAAEVARKAKEAWAQRLAAAAAARVLEQRRATGAAA